MTLRLFDTSTRSVRHVAPLQPPEVRWDTCGPTVDDYAPLGNRRTDLCDDLVRRVLACNGDRVKPVMHLTAGGHLVSDADTGEDKREQGSRRTGQSAWEMAECSTQAFTDNLGPLNLLEPTLWCRATAHRPAQIATIRCIEAKGLTYRTADGIDFDTSQWPTAGELARLDITGLHAGMRVDMGEKHHPTDVAVWQFRPPEQQRPMAWDSPWGVGFSPAGIATARRWRPRTWGGSATGPVAVKITFRCTIPRSSRRPRPAMAPASPTFGGTGPCYSSTTRRGRNRRATSSACRPWWSGAMIRGRIASSA
jgi:cysteinyl-tRNA synthetase